MALTRCTRCGKMAVVSGTICWECQSAVARQDQLVKDLGRQGKDAEYRQRAQINEEIYRSSARLQDVLDQGTFDSARVRQVWLDAMSKTQRLDYERIDLEVAAIQALVKPDLKWAPMAWGIGIGLFGMIFVAVKSAKIDDPNGIMFNVLMLFNLIASVAAGAFGSLQLARMRTASNDLIRKPIIPLLLKQQKMIQAVVIESAPGIEKLKGSEAIVSALTKCKLAKELAAAIKADEEEGNQLEEELISGL